MGEIRGQTKKSLIVKTWQRCKSIGRGQNTRAPTSPCRSSLKGRVAPEGCFSVYVGPEKQRFVIKTEYANHPLFMMLLEEAEMEYGYSSEGPLELPCDVDLFLQVLLEMESDDAGDRIVKQRCGFSSRGSASYHPLCPSPLIAMNQF